jgi:hypothetical protein
MPDHRTTELHLWGLHLHGSVNEDTPPNHQIFEKLAQVI